jgi:transposase
MEQRYEAVRMVQDGFTISEIAAKFNVTRQSVYRWMLYPIMGKWDKLR